MNKRIKLTEDHENSVIDNTDIHTCNKYKYSGINTMYDIKINRDIHHPLREKRFVHNSQFGIVCPFFTSDGDACDLIKSICGGDTIRVRDWLMDEEGTHILGGIDPTKNITNSLYNSDDVSNR